MASLADDTVSLVEECNSFLNAHQKYAHFSGSVLISKGDKIVYAQGYGEADRELAIPTSTETKFSLASLTKQFCAATVLQLVQDGKLDLKQTIDRWFPDQTRANEITIHNLLSMSSGIQNVTEVAGGDIVDHWRVRRSNAELLKPIFPMSLLFDPGSSYRYSNTNYVMLVLVVENISGQFWPEYLSQHMLKPLNLNDTGIDYPEKILLKRAKGYIYEGREKDWENAPWEDRSLSIGSTGMYSTVLDMHAWSRGLLHSSIILREETRELMTTGHIERLTDRYYGYGLRVEKDFSGQKKLTHSGECWSGFLTRNEMYPDAYDGQGACVVVLANSRNTDPEAIATGLGSILFSGPRPSYPIERTTVEMSSYSKYLGIYELQEPYKCMKFTLRISGEDPKILEMVRDGNVRAKLEAKDESTFWLIDLPEKLVFEFDSDGFVVGWTEPWSKAVKIE